MLQISFLVYPFSAIRYPLSVFMRKYIVCFLFTSVNLHNPLDPRSILRMIDKNNLSRNLYLVVSI